MAEQPTVPFMDPGANGFVIDRRLIVVEQRLGHTDLDAVDLDQHSPSIR